MAASDLEHMLQKKEQFAMGNCLSQEQTHSTGRGYVRIVTCHQAMPCDPCPYMIEENYGMQVNPVGSRSVLLALTMITSGSTLSP